MTDASVDEQIAAIRREEEPVAFGAARGRADLAAGDAPDGEEALDFAPPKTGSYEPLDPPNSRLWTRR